MPKKKLTNRADILKTLAAILEPWLNDIDDTNLLNEQTDLLSDLGLDSVAILQLILGVEKEFSVTIKASELDSNMFSRMKNLIDIIECKVNETN